MFQNPFLFPQPQQPGVMPVQTQMPTTGVQPGGGGGGHPIVAPPPAQPQQQQGGDPSMATLLPQLQALNQKYQQNQLAAPPVASVSAPQGATPGYTDAMGGQIPGIVGVPQVTDPSQQKPKLLGGLLSMLGLGGMSGLAGGGAG